MREAVEVKIRKLHPTAVVPRYMTAHAAGLDLTTVIEEPLTLQPGERTLLPTGLALAIPPGYEGQVRPRSGLALKQGVALVNAPGTIDADYRGELGVIVINLGLDPVTFRPGDRIAQLIITPVTRVQLCEVDQLDDTERSGGGFGHTGGNGSP
jgi:dUTP pyrophosphatase